MILHLAQPEAEWCVRVLATRLDELEGGFIFGGSFDEAGGAHTLGFGDAAHGSDHGGVDGDVFEFDGRDAYAPV